MARRTIKVFTDYKSPYAYLAMDPTYDLARETGVALDWLPYTLDIPAYLGSAKVDAQGNVVEQSRNAHQWRRVKYSYMDCRREANLRGLTIRGPQKIWDSSLAGIGLLYAKHEDRRRGGEAIVQAYNHRVFEQFWRRALDIEDVAVLGATLAACGADPAGFTSYAAGEGRQELDGVREAAEAAGVFGVQSFLLENGDLYWGREHLPRLKELLAA